MSETFVIRTLKAESKVTSFFFFYFLTFSIRLSSGMFEERLMTFFTHWSVLIGLNEFHN